MRINFRRVALGIAVAAIFILLLARVADLKLSSFSDVSPFYVGPAVLLSMLTLALRALNYRVIANQAEPRPMSTWLDLSLRHQFLFTAVPSGLGDIGFPMLAKRYVGTDLAEGAAIIVMARLRDLCFLPAMGCAGLVASGHVPQVFFPLGISLAASGFFAEQLVAPLCSLLRHIGISRTVPEVQPTSTFQNQFARSTCTLASWLSAGCALWSAYQAAGTTLSPATVFILLAGLNLIGVLAISVGGLGVAEAGSTGLLVTLGMPLDEAAQLSLVARPILLLSVIVSCAIWWWLRGKKPTALTKHQTIQLKPENENLPSS